MAIEKMKFVMVATDPESVLPMINGVMNCKNFHPELATDVVQDGDGGLLYPNDRVYDGYLARCDRIVSDLHLGVSSTIKKEYTLEEIEDRISAAEKKYETLYSQQSTLSSLTEDDRKALDRLKEYPFEDVDDGFVKIHFGRIPIQSLSKITLHNDERFVFSELHRTKQYGWIVWVCLNEDDERLSAMFESLFFEAIAIPINLNDGLTKECEDLLDGLYGFIKQQTIKESYYRYISLYEGQAVLAGFIPADRLDVFCKLFDERMKIIDMDASEQTTILAPTRLKNGWFSRPFESFVEMYGLPKYGEFDPTFYFAITYCLLFGIMFGDLGQGLVILLGGLYFAKKKHAKLGDIAIRLGMFSMIFGTLYGSWFGNEEILTPILNPVGLPIHVTSPDFTMNLLISTVVLGIGLILTSMLINIILSFKRRDFTKAIYDQNGLAGFVFYGFIMVGIACMAKGTNIFNVGTIIAFIVIPILMILFKEPFTNLLNKVSASPEAGWGSYLVESFFELFEVLLSFIANTMSFLRVGGFVLSHAGMMSVVWTLNDMAGGAGIFVRIIGNVFVIGLEGLIVGIQTLRLEYYEMFSRYYEGGGKPFKSVI